MLISGSKKAKAAQGMMLFKQDDLVVHESGKIYKVVKPPYARKTIITVDAVEQRGGKIFGSAKAIPASKFVRPAKVSDLKGKGKSAVVLEKVAPKATSGAVSKTKPSAGKKGEAQKGASR